MEHKGVFLSSKKLFMDLFGSLKSFTGVINLFVLWFMPIKRTQLDNGYFRIRLCALTKFPFLFSLLDFSMTENGLKKVFEE